MGRSGGGRGASGKESGLLSRVQETMSRKDKTLHLLQLLWGELWWWC